LNANTSRGQLISVEGLLRSVGEKGAAGVELPAMLDEASPPPEHCTHGYREAERTGQAKRGFHSDELCSSRLIFVKANPAPLQNVTLAHARQSAPLSHHP